MSATPVVPTGSSTLEADVVVVGSGPAGLAAARELGRRGHSVVLIDEHAELGGQYFRQRPPALVQRHGPHRARGAELIADVVSAGAKILTGTVVWGVGDDGRTLLVAPADGRRADGEAQPSEFGALGAIRAVRTPACIVATGAFERAIPFPGWELPGVVTPGYALHLAHVDCVPLGSRVVVAGSGPFLLAAADAILRAGGGVAAVVEMNRPYGLSRAAFGALRFPSRLAELARYATTLARHRVPVFQSAMVVEARGTARVERVTIGPRMRTIDVDALAVGFGFRPSSELLQLLGVAGSFDALGDFRVDCDAQGRTSVAGVYAAGEVVALAGARAAEARGVLVAAAADADLRGVSGTAVASRIVEGAGVVLARERTFAKVVDALFPMAPERLVVAEAATLVCRCEGVTASAIMQAADLGWNDPASAKGATRAGMGPCQGRLCAPVVSALVARATGRRDPPPAPRMPLKPVPLAELASLTEPSTVVDAL